MRHVTFTRSAIAIATMLFASLAASSAEAGGPWRDAGAKARGQFGTRGMSGGWSSGGRSWSAPMVQQAPAYRAPAATARVPGARRSFSVQPTQPYSGRAYAPRNWRPFYYYGW